MPARKRCVNVFSPVVGNRPADEIIAQIRVKLSAQELKAGDRLPSERELSEQFAVSRNSVRQALRTLAELGLLDIRKGASGGAFIHEGGGGAVAIRLQDLYTLGTIRPEDLTEVRLLLSVEVARLACEHARKRTSTRWRPMSSPPNVLRANPISVNAPRSISSSTACSVA